MERAGQGARMAGRGPDHHPPEAPLRDGMARGLRSQSVRGQIQLGDVRQVLEAPCLSFPPVR